MCVYFFFVEKKGFGLIMEIKLCDVFVRGDFGWFVWIFGNLLLNVVKFMCIGYIYVGVLYGNGRFLLFVRDIGIGIDKEW